MRIPSRHLTGPPDASTATTPMIDVVFLLLIFFVCAAAGAVQERSLAADLSAAGGIQTELPLPERDPWTVEIWLKLTRGEGNQLTIDANGTRYPDLDRLEQQLIALAAVDAANPVILDIGAGVSWGEVIEVYDRCRRCGLQSVNFAMDAPPRPASR
jgi:biopolymer transport protein ExbD